MNRRLLTVEELSELTGLSKNTIYCWVSQRRIPVVKCSRLIGFDPRRIEKWTEHERPTKTRPRLCLFDGNWEQIIHLVKKIDKTYEETS